MLDLTQTKNVLRLIQHSIECFTLPPLLMERILRIDNYSKLHKHILVNFILYIFKSITIQGRSYREARGAPRPLPISENFFFLKTKTEKSTFQGAYSYAIYINEDITQPCLRNFGIIGFTTSCPGDLAMPLMLLRTCQDNILFCDALLLVLPFKSILIYLSDLQSEN